MGCAKSKFTVLFEEPFWVGIYERQDGDRYEVCKITFGPEPKDYEVYDYLLKNWSKLQFSPPINTDSISEKRLNPKRAQRTAKKQLRETGMGTKAQQALKLQQEQGKLKRKKLMREQKKAEKEHLFKLRLGKRKEKRKGR